MAADFYAGSYPQQFTDVSQLTGEVARPDHIQATIQQINQFANEDVEMLVPRTGTVFVVVDTNILLHHLNILDDFVTVIDRHDPIPVVIIIPGIVVAELDSQKNRVNIWWFSRTASTWLLSKIKARKSVRGQTERECTVPPPRNWVVRSSIEGDSYVLDCCLFFSQNGHRTLLLSGDKNLCVRAETLGIATVSSGERWNSRHLAQEIARVFPGVQLNFSQFSTYRGQSYKSASNVTDGPASTPQQQQSDEDSMEVDPVEDDSMDVETISRQDARNSLHEQAVGLFTRLLSELVGQIGGNEILAYQNQGPTGLDASRYAPEWKKLRKHYWDWDATALLEFLDGRRPTRHSNPPLSRFLRKPYSGDGARCGQDWSSKDWEEALKELKLVGMAWEDDGIAEALSELQPHLTTVFGQAVNII